MLVKLSNATALKLPLPEGKRQMLYRDTMTKGFGVVVGRETKTYVLRFKTRAGEERQHKIGVVGVIACEEARKEAIRILAEVHKGADPTAALRQARAEGTLKDELLAWFDAHAMQPTTRKTWKSVINTHLLPALGTRKPSTITKADILVAYRGIQAKSGRQANQAVIILSTFYNRITDGKFNPASDFRNDKSIRKHRDAEREVVLTQDQVRALLADFDLSPAQQSADATRLLFYTGARIGEILGLRWDAVNLTQGTLTLAYSGVKEAKTKTLHLSPRAQAILERRREEALKGAEYVFPGKDGGGHQTVIKAFWAGACKRCGIEGVHIHDIRATYSTHLIASGESAKAVGKTMGHADAKTTMRYERIAQDRAKHIASKVDELF
ncbi:MAG: tyrosine-type recombinase/integrase [Magnetospirillum sp.]|nr:tyrosine-type recombinase/integrase [Magnetospirillum sp.]